MGREIIAWKVPYWKQLEADVDCSLTQKWLTSAELKAETEGLAVAAQDQSLATRSCQHRVLNQDVNPMQSLQPFRTKKPSITLQVAALNLQVRVLT